MKMLNLKFQLFSFIFSLIAFTSVAQDWELEVPHDFGLGLGFDVVETADGGFVMVGDIDYPTGAIRHYIRLVKADAMGNELWSHVYNDGAIGMDTGRSILETDDGGFIIVGGGGGEFKGLVMRTDMNGDSLWTKFHGDNSFFNFNAIVENGTGYIAVGSSANNVGGEESIWAVGLNETGDTLWTKNYYENSSFSKGRDIVATQDGAFLITGSVDGSVAILKINDQGDLLWSNEALQGFDASGLSVAELADGVIVIGGYETGIAGLTPIVLTMNDMGDLINSFIPPNEGLGTTSSVAATDDGGYVVAGALFDFWTQSFGDTSGYVIKYDNQGEVDFHLVLDQEIRAQASEIKQTTDGGYIISGAYSLGMFLKRIEGGTNAIYTNSSQSNIAEIYPNPASHQIVLELSEGLNAEGLSLSIFDNEGHLIEEYKINEGTTVIPTVAYPFGLYQTVISKKGKLLQTSPVVIAK